MNKVLLLIAALVILSGCQGTPRYGGGFHTNESDARSDVAKKAAVVSTGKSATKYTVQPLEMGRIIDRYLGRPYAGKTVDGKRGMDCSEFVGAVYEEYGSIHLPRTAKAMYKAGRKVQKGDLYFGDLLFFDTGGRGVSHVGIYIGFNEFAHSSSTNGIIISSLDDKYYKKRFLSARRVME